MRFSEGCPIVTQLLEPNGEAYREGWNNGLFTQVAQGLSAQMRQAVPGTRAGLTDERVEEIRREEVARWGNVDDPDGEAAYLEAHPEMAKAIHDCELHIQLGQCGLNHSK